MDEKGLPEDEVLRLLEEARARDLKYADGRILGSMCTSPHPVALKAHEQFMETNLGDAGLFPGTKGLERRAITMLGELLHDPGAYGFIVSGGTEANLTALWAARNDAGEKTEVILPETAHFSFHKSCDILALRAVEVPVGSDHTVDIEAVKEVVTDDTIAMVGIAGSTEYGIVDDIPALSDIAIDEGIYLHVDAAFGGFVLPFLEDAPAFDFSLEGVSSITIDPHKMGLSTIPSGGILFRDPGPLGKIRTDSPYLTEKHQHTIIGTRSGAAAASTCAVMKALGREGYRENVKRCMEVTMLLRDGIRALGLRTSEPVTSILAFSATDDTVRALEERGWMVSRTRRGEVRLVIMPHVKEEHARAFLEDLGAVL